MRIDAVYQVSTHPPIYFSAGSKNWPGLPDAPRGATMLAHTMWHFGWRSLLTYARLRRSLARRGIRLVLMHASPEELRFARLFGFEGHLASHNIHCQENVFTVGHAEIAYDAVYTAAAKPYKRIHLAAGVARLYVVTYFWPDVRDEKGEWDLHAFEPRVSHADFNRTMLTRRQVNEIYARSVCGLALSAKEGAMFASMEYLMAGLPIVSTPSRGGRDVFFDPRHCLIVPATVEGVRRGVQEAACLRLRREDVRASAMDKILAQRRAFHAVVRETAVRGGGDVEGFDDFHERVWGGDGVERVRIA